MASSDRTPQYRKEDNMIRIICLQEQMLEQTRCRRNMVDWFMIKTKDTTRRVAKQTKLYRKGINKFKSPILCQKQIVEQTRCRRQGDGQPDVVHAAESCRHLHS